MSANPHAKRIAAWATAGVAGAVAVGSAALAQVGIAAADSASAGSSLSASIRASVSPAAPGAPGPDGPGIYGLDMYGPGMHEPGGPNHRARGGAELAAVAKIIGITQAELQQKLFAGQSLATIAEAEGIALDTVINAIVTQETAELAAAVTAGRLTQTQADQISKDLLARVTERVNRVPGSGGPSLGGPSDWARGGPGERRSSTAVPTSSGTIA